MRIRPIFMLAAAALLSLQLHAWTHADHGLSGNIEICAGCQLSQHGGTLQSHHALPAFVAPAPVRAAAPPIRHAQRLPQTPLARGPPALRIS